MFHVIIIRWDLDGHLPQATVVRPSTERSNMCFGSSVDM